MCKKSVDCLLEVTFVSFSLIPYDTNFSFLGGVGTHNNRNNITFNEIFPTDDCVASGLRRSVLSVR